MLPWLQYHLNTDKPKANATSIQTNYELKIFKDWMRLLIMPQKLTNGKISTHALRPVTVYFEDGSPDNVAHELIDLSKATSKKYVSIPLIPF